MADVVTQRYRLSTLAALLVLLVVMGASVWNLPAPWAVEMVKTLMLGAVGVLLVNKDTTS